MTLFGRWLKNRGRSVWESSIASGPSGILYRLNNQPLRFDPHRPDLDRLLAFGVFSNRSNMDRRRRSDRQPGLERVRVPSDAEWTGGPDLDGLRFHVPVAVFTARSAWAPAHGRKMDGVFLHGPYANRAHMQLELDQPRGLREPRLALHWLCGR